MYSFYTEAQIQISQKVYTYFNLKYNAWQMDLRVFQINAYY